MTTNNVSQVQLMSSPMQMPDHGNRQMELKVRGLNGLFIGNSLLGSALLVLGFWWWIEAVKDYASHLDCLNRHTPARVSPTAQKKCASCRLFSKPQSLEAVFKIVVSLIGFIVDTALVAQGRESPYANYSIWSVFLLCGLVDFLIAMNVPLPPNINKLTHLVLFGGLAVVQHIQGQGHLHLAATCRLLQSYLGGLGVASLLHRLAAPTSLLSALSLALLTAMQGAWLCQTGLVLDAPNAQFKWTEASHANVMYATILFGCVLAACLVAMTAILLIALRLTSSYGSLTLFSSYSPSTLSSSALLNDDKSNKMDISQEKHKTSVSLSLLFKGNAPSISKSSQRSKMGYDRLKNLDENEAVTLNHTN